MPDLLVVERKSIRQKLWRARAVDFFFFFNGENCNSGSGIIGKDYIAEY